MIVWIGSYPKSGNTWVRAMLSAFFYSKDGIFDFKLLDNISQFPQDFDFISQSLTSSTSLRDMADLWIKAQQRINEDGKLKFLKTHGVLNLPGHHFTDKANSLAGIYVVRDPRNVITSLGNHFDLSPESSFDFLTNELNIISINNENRGFTYIGDWKNNYLCWKSCDLFKLKIVRYEDLLNSTYKEFIGILNFLESFTEIAFDQAKIDNIVKTTEFSRMQSDEQRLGFSEAQIRSGRKKAFFHLGGENKWERNLDKDISEKICSRYLPEMKELGYL